MGNKNFLFVANILTSPKEMLKGDVRRSSLCVVTLTDVSFYYNFLSNKKIILSRLTKTGATLRRYGACFASKAPLLIMGLTKAELLSGPQRSKGPKEAPFGLLLVS